MHRVLNQHYFKSAYIHYHVLFVIDSMSVIIRAKERVAALLGSFSKKSNVYVT